MTAARCSGKVRTVSIKDRHYRAMPGVRTPSNFLASCCTCSNCCANSCSDSNAMLNSATHLSLSSEFSCTARLPESIICSSSNNACKSIPFCAMLRCPSIPGIALWPINIFSVPHVISSILYPRIRMFLPSKLNGLPAAVSSSVAKNFDITRNASTCFSNARYSANRDAASSGVLVKSLTPNSGGCRTARSKSIFSAVSVSFLCFA